MNVGQALGIFRWPGMPLRPLRMRTLLLVSLLALSLGLTALSLLVVRFTLQRQVRRDLGSDLRHSVDTFLNLERQRRQMLARETALLADLPSLKALMTTQDARTIQDGGRDFWLISCGDLFQLYDRTGHLMAAYGRNASLNRLSAASMRAVIEQPQETRIVALDGRIYEVIAQPLSFGARTGGTLLGYVVLGSAVDRNVALEVSQAAAAEVAFSIDGKIAVSTLGAALNDGSPLRTLERGSVAGVTLNGESYLAIAMPLNTQDSASGSIQLIVLRSYKDAARVARTINRWLLGLGALAVVLGTLIAVSISRLVTGPLEKLVDGARLLGRGEFRHTFSGGGTAEIRELAEAFDHMRLELQTSHRALVDSERLATIGRMASSISHDLRHYISAMYANAEFLSLASTPQAERDELIFEVQTAVQGMTDLLDSLLGFSRTGKALLLTYESLPYLIERAVILLRAHPEARSLDVCLSDLPSIEAWVDATKIVRTVFNLLLNAYQAANRGTLAPNVTLRLSEDDREIILRIMDNGPGVPASLVPTMFEPFVSRDREYGTGLGLTMAQHIAQEHGGAVTLEESVPGRTVFSLSLNKPALQRLRESSLTAMPVRDVEGIDLRSAR